MRGGQVPPLRAATDWGPVQAPGRRRVLREPVDAAAAAVDPRIVSRRNHENDLADALEQVLDLISLCIRPSDDRLISNVRSLFQLCRFAMTNDHLDLTLLHPLLTAAAMPSNSKHAPPRPSFNNTRLTWLWT